MQLYIHYVSLQWNNTSFTHSNKSSVNQIIQELLLLQYCAEYRTTSHLRKAQYSQTYGTNSNYHTLFSYLLHLDEKKKLYCLCSSTILLYLMEEAWQRKILRIPTGFKEKWNWSSRTKTLLQQMPTTSAKNAQSAMIITSVMSTI
jgi:hypothetical protein